MKILKMIALFLACRLVWIWLDQCGADLGLGDALPFCLNCSGVATFFRLGVLGLGVYVVIRFLQEPPDIDHFPEDDPIPGQTYIVHWDRIALLFAVVTYPLWIWWVDSNTAIPGPAASLLTKSICKYAGLKGTLIWSVIVTFCVMSFKFLYKK
jgi:hypothetical protein